MRRCSLAFGIRTADPDADVASGSARTWFCVTRGDRRSSFSARNNAVAWLLGNEVDSIETEGGGARLPLSGVCAWPLIARGDVGSRSRRRRGAARDRSRLFVANVIVETGADGTGARGRWCECAGAARGETVCVGAARRAAGCDADAVPLKCCVVVVDEKGGRCWKLEYGELLDCELSELCSSTLSSEKFSNGATRASRVTWFPSSAAGGGADDW